MRMKRTLMTAVAAVSITTLGLAAAAPALADTQSHQDPRGDVVALTAKAKAKAGIDIVSSTNTYEGGSLTMKIEARKLLKDNFAGYWLITTADTSYLLISAHFEGQSQVQFQEVGSMPPRAGVLARAGALGRGGQPPTCDGVKARTPKGKDSLVATVPRSCLGGANTVRIGAALIRLNGNEEQVDDARRDGFSGTSQPKLGPALHRN